MKSICVQKHKEIVARRNKKILSYSKIKRLKRVGVVK